MTVPIPILPYVPQQTTAVSVEVQPLDADHRMHAMPLHAHTFFELLFFTRGSGVHQVGGSHHPVTAGTTFVVAPGVTHDARALQGAEGWVVLFLPDSVNARLASGLNPPGSAPSDLLLDVFRQPTLQMTRPITMDDAVFDRSIQLIETMAQELADKPLGYEVAVRSALQLLLVHLARCTPGVAPTQFDAAQPDRKRALVHRVFEDIDRHFPEAGGLDAASRRLGLNAGYLTTQMRKLTGKTYGDWLIERRMIEGRRLLVGSGLPAAWRRATRTAEPAD